MWELILNLKSQILLVYFLPSIHPSHQYGLVVHMEAVSGDKDNQRHILHVMPVRGRTRPQYAIYIMVNKLIHNMTHQHNLSI